MPSTNNNFVYLCAKLYIRGVPKKLGEKKIGNQESKKK